MLGGVILISSDGPTELRVGYWLALAAMAVAGLVFLVEGVRSRRKRAAPVWRWLVGRATVTLLPLLLVLALLVVVGISVLFE